MTDEILKIIKQRRSVRQFEDEEINDDKINNILEAARWAPSGLNNQPWRFVIVKDKKMKKQLSQLSHYGKIIDEANVAIAVFLDNNVGYDRTKDTQAIGACIQNMLLEVEAQNLGACWIGEILNRKEEVEKLLAVPHHFELMAVIAIGVPKRGKKLTSTRYQIDKLIYKKY